MVTKNLFGTSFALDRWISIILISVNYRYFENDRALEDAQSLFIGGEAFEIGEILVRGCSD